MAQPPRPPGALPQPRASAPPPGARPYRSRASVAEEQLGGVAVTLMKQRLQPRRWWWLCGPQRRRRRLRGLRNLGRREGSREAGSCRCGRARRWRGRGRPRGWRWRRRQGPDAAGRCSECGIRPRLPACWAARSATARAAAPGPCAPACRRRCSLTRGTRTLPRPAAARLTAAVGGRCHCPGHAQSARERGLGSDAGRAGPPLSVPAGGAGVPMLQHPNTSPTHICLPFTPCRPSRMGLPTLIGPWVVLPIASCLQFPIVLTQCLALPCCPGSGLTAWDLNHGSPHVLLLAFILESGGPGWWPSPSEDTIIPASHPSPSP